MKVWQETVTKREGENMGPIDPTYDVHQYGTYPNNPEIPDKKFTLLLEMEKQFIDGKKLRVWYTGDFSGDLLDVGMYDGWPFWRPTPAFQLNHWHGAEWHFWYDLQRYEIIGETNAD